MNKINLIIWEYLLVCGWFLLGNGQSSAPIPGYYWRDYFGTLPHDAVRGGKENGQVTYIGQSLFNGLVVPSKIVPEDKLSYFEWGNNVYNSSESVMVLCTNTQNYLSWTKSDSTSFISITDKHFIVAGSENGTPLYVGRHRNDESDVILGKLLADATSATLYAPYRGQAVRYTEFEVLYFDPLKAGYKPNKNKVDVSPCVCEDKLVSVNLIC